MKLSNVKGMIAAVIAASTMMTTAHAAVSCPTAAEVKDSSRALNAVIRQSQKTFFVLSAQPAISSSDLGWMVLTQANATGFDAAYTAGTNDVKAVTLAAMDKPIEQQGMYICAYFTSTGGMNVMAVAQQQQGLIFNPAKLNLDAIKPQA